MTTYDLDAHAGLRDLWEEGALSLASGHNYRLQLASPEEAHRLRFQLYQYRVQFELATGKPWMRDLSISINKAEPTTVQFMRSTPVYQVVKNSGEDVAQ